MSTLRERISQAAKELYLREGLEGFSMRRVAEMVGVSAPAIYRHYQNKDELLNEIIIEGLKILDTYLRPALSAKTPYERLLQLLEGYLNFAVEQPKYFDFAFITPSSGIDRFPAELAKHDWTTFTSAVGQIYQCLEQGVLKKDDPIETAITLWAEVHGLVSLYRVQRFGQSLDTFRQIYWRAVRRILQGLREEGALTEVSQADGPSPTSPTSG
jgi:AcrR family transcriptional regulator